MILHFNYATKTITFSFSIGLFLKLPFFKGLWISVEYLMGYILILIYVFKEFNNMIFTRHFVI